MKIAFISLMKILPWGGSEELWHRMAKLAITKGYSVSTLTQQWPTNHKRINELEELGAEINFYHAPTYSLIDRIGIKLKLAKWLPEFVPNISADIYVISNGSVFDYVYNQHTIANIISKGKPYVMISQHNHENGNVVPDFYRGYAVETMRKAAVVLFVSERNLQAAERQIAHRITNGKVVSNPLNIQSVSIKDYPVGDKLLMGCVARLDCAAKGQDILLHVLSSNLWKNRNFHLSLYGSGPHEKYLNELIKFYNIADKVSLVGQVSDIDEVWQNNQVLVLPSINEGTPLALIEAMLSGRAAVTTDVGGNSKYVIEDETGFIIDVASVKQLGVVLEKLWLNKMHLQHMGEKAFKHALEITDLHPDATALYITEQVLN